MLKKCFQLIDGMIEICTVKSWLQTTLNVIDLMQCMTQALWFKDSSLLQLPNFNEAAVKSCSGGKNSMRSLREFIKADPESRRGMAKFTDEERNEVNRICKILPDIDMKVEVGVDDEENIAEGDVLCIIEAMKLIWQRLKIVVEPSAAVPLAVIFKNQEIFSAKKIGIIVSGGNIDLNKLPFN